MRAAARFGQDWRTYLAALTRDEEAMLLAFDRVMSDLEDRQRD